MPTNTQILLNHRPTDKVSPANFRIVETPVPAPGPDQVLVRHTFLSLDPYMRGRLSDAKSYAKPQEIGAVMGGGTVGTVEASNNPRFHPGDAVVGGGGWQRYSLSDGKALRIVDAKSVPIQAYLGALGMPGVTAWYGLNQIIEPKSGETVLVSAATGAAARSSASLPNSPARARSESPGVRRNAPTPSRSWAMTSASTTSRRTSPRS
jgi:NADPH-dependent curcumin reductase